MKIKRKPEWLKVKIKAGKNLNGVTKILKELSLNTVCEEANCPNRMECFDKKTAAFMILGNICTRGCRFCNVKRGLAGPVNTFEPENIARAVEKLGLYHVVITSVTRDDLTDGGSSHFARVIEAVRENNKEVKIEVLIPDFKGCEKSLEKVTAVFPYIINHNIETVPSLYKTVRPDAEYGRSLELLDRVKGFNNNIKTKTGIMLGLGEKIEEVLDVFKDLAGIKCDAITIGQYLAPSEKHHPVVEYIKPELFDYYKKEALLRGIKYAASAPLVRSSYNASKMFEEN